MKFTAEFSFSTGSNQSQQVTSSLHLSEVQRWCKKLETSQQTQLAIMVEEKLLKWD